MQRDAHKGVNAASGNAAGLKPGGKEKSKCIS